MLNTLLACHGPLLTGEPLARALGFRTTAALRQAKRQSRVGVTVFTPPARQGLFALTTDVVDWLHDVREREGGAEPCPE